MAMSALPSVIDFVTKTLRFLSSARGTSAGRSDPSRRAKAGPTSAQKSAEIPLFGGETIKNPLPASPAKKATLKALPSQKRNAPRFSSRTWRPNSAFFYPVSLLQRLSSSHPYLG
jgi:hypothetical protein